MPLPDTLLADAAGHLVRVEGVRAGLDGGAAHEAVPLLVLVLALMIFRGDVTVAGSCCCLPQYAGSDKVCELVLVLFHTTNGLV